ncbi:MAG: efflux RND transporter periplasmic adaptor subunit [Marinilabiliaceae bacterium]|nr:efflux RND transporter periplasmic adaptor subunit [Marinilabiliaceae bacterium]
MDIQLEKKPWYIRHKYTILLGVAIAALSIYAIALAVGPKQLKISKESTFIGKVEDTFFLEYVDVEGIVQPISTIRINATESGSLARIIADDGSTLHKGDSILLLENNELIRTINDEYDDWTKQKNLLEEQRLTLEQKVISLRQQSLEYQYELIRLDKDITVKHEEFRMGIISKAQLEMADSENEFRRQKTSLQLQSLKHDSAATVIRQQLLQSDILRNNKRIKRIAERADNLVIRASADGQFSFNGAALGQRIMNGECIGEIKVLSSYKVIAMLNEYYIDRISVGLSANIVYQDKRYELRISRIVPEIKNHLFEVDLTFTGEMPPNARLGKNYKLQVELGQQEKALVMPRGDFYATTNGKWIFKLTKDGKKAVRVPITIGRQNPKQYEILDGLAPNDEVIVNGYSDYANIEELIIK